MYRHQITLSPAALTELEQALKNQITDKAKAGQNFGTAEALLRLFRAASYDAANDEYPSFLIPAALANEAVLTGIADRE